MVRSLVVSCLLVASTTLWAKPFVLAAEDDYYPFSAQVEGKLVGLVPALATAAYEAVNREVEFVVKPFSRALMLTRTGQVVGGFTGAIDDSNEADFIWHETPLSIVRLVIWGRADSPERGLSAEDLDGERVSITRGFLYTDAVDQNEKVNKLVAPSDEASMKMLALGRSDYALVTEQIGYGIVASASQPRLEDKVKIVGVIDEVPLHIFFSRAHPRGEEAAGLFQQGLEIIIENGEYDRLVNQWLPGPAGS